MGNGERAGKEDMKTAYELGKLIASEGWILLSGGMNAGVMQSVNKGAKENGGLTVGIISRQDAGIAEGVDIPIMTDMGSARNNINVLTSNVIVACGMGPGTSSEVSLALQNRANKPVVLLNNGEETIKFFRTLREELVHVAKNPEEAIEIIKNLLIKKLA